MNAWSVNSNFLFLVLKRDHGIQGPVSRVGIAIDLIRGAVMVDDTALAHHFADDPTVRLPLLVPLFSLIYALSSFTF